MEYATIEPGRVAQVSQPEQGTEMTDKKKKLKKKLDSPIYGVAWVEVEFGQRDAGWKLFASLEDCKNITKNDSTNGPYPGGYIGPQRPSAYCVIPIEGLEEKYEKALLDKGRCFTDDRWKPKYKGLPAYLKE